MIRNSAITKPSRERIANTILELVKNMLQERNLSAQQLNENTSLTDELGLTSLDALQLMAAIDARFGTTLPFEKFVVLESGYRMVVTIGQFADFIEKHFHDLPGT